MELSENFSGPGKMDNAGLPSPQMDWDASNLSEAWRKFKLHVDLMFSGPFKQKPEDEKCTYLLLWVGERGRDIYDTWILTAEEKKVLKTYYDRFEAYVMPRTNVILARYRFNEKVQAAHEPFEQFVTDLRLLAKDCNYTESDEMIRDRVVFGTNSPRVRDKLLSVGSELTLDKAIDIARSHEIAQTQLRSTAGDSNHYEEPTVRTVGQHTESIPWKACKEETIDDPDYVHETEGAGERIKGCSHCGDKDHTAEEDCPAEGKQCTLCNKWNHLAEVCPMKGEGVHTNLVYQSPVDNVNTSTVATPPVAAPAKLNLIYQSPVDNINPSTVVTAPAAAPANLCNSGPVINIPGNIVLNLQPLGLLRNNIELVSAPPPVNTFISKKRRRESRQDESKPYIKKPLNAFMLFLKEQRPIVVAELNACDSAGVNRILGERWRSLPKHQQAIYYEQAEREAQLHAQQHPGWSTTENYGKMQKRVRRKGPIGESSASTGSTLTGPLAYVLETPRPPAAVTQRHQL